jgi:hypothetical protein
MSASREWTEWHLTPSGWQRGSKETDFAPATKVEPPEDRVLSCVYKETVASSYGGFGIDSVIAGVDSGGSSTQHLLQPVPQSLLFRLGLLKYLFKFVKLQHPHIFDLGL